MRNPVFGAVQYPVVAVFYSRGFHVAGVAAGVRLGQSPSTNVLSRCQLGQPAALLRFIAKCENVVGAQTVVGGQAQAYGATHFGYFLNDGVVLEIPETGTAIFMRYQYAHQAQLAHGSKSIYGKMLGFIPFHYMGANVLLGKITGSRCYVQRGF